MFWKARLWKNGNKNDRKQQQIRIKITKKTVNIVMYHKDLPVISLQNSFVSFKKPKVVGKGEPLQSKRCKEDMGHFLKQHILHWFELVGEFGKYIVLEITNDNKAKDWSSSYPEAKSNTHRLYNFDHGRSHDGLYK